MVIDLRHNNDHLDRSLKESLVEAEEILQLKRELSQIKDAEGKSEDVLRLEITRIVAEKAEVERLLEGER